jgi:hypothetical protein
MERDKGMEEWRCFKVKEREGRRRKEMMIGWIRDGKEILKKLLSLIKFDRYCK